MPILDASQCNSNGMSKFGRTSNEVVVNLTLINSKALVAASFHENFHAFMHSVIGANMVLKL
jgi:hypothetical protein